MSTLTKIRLLGAAMLFGMSVAAPARAQSRPTDRDDAPRTDRSMPSGSDARTTLGFSASLSGGDRDTLGVLISSVVPDGVADRAGIADGNRLAAINGVSLRVASDAIGDRSAEDAILRNLARELRDAQPGDELSLRVYAAGRFRNVTVQTPAPVRPRAIPSRANNDNDVVPTTTISAVIDGLARLQTQLTKLAPSCGVSESVPGLGVTTVASELAPYFGDGAEYGLLVLKAGDNWSPLRPGDVILRIDGATASTSRLRALSEERTPVGIEILRRKRVVEVSLDEGR
jgi:S1-C subfamily serine protease